MPVSAGIFRVPVSERIQEPTERLHHRGPAALLELTAEPEYSRETFLSARPEGRYCLFSPPHLSLRTNKTHPVLGRKNFHPVGKAWPSPVLTLASGGRKWDLCQKLRLSEIGSSALGDGKQDADRLAFPSWPLSCVFPGPWSWSEYWALYIMDPAEPALEM